MFLEHVIGDVHLVQVLYDTLHILTLHQSQYLFEHQGYHIILQGQPVTGQPEPYCLLKLSDQPHALLLGRQFAEVRGEGTGPEYMALGVVAGPNDMGEGQVRQQSPVLVAHDLLTHIIPQGQVVSSHCQPAHILISPVPTLLHGIQV